MNRPRWWTPPTWLYGGRRWDDIEGSDLFNRARRITLALWPFVAALAALAVVAAAMFAIVSIADQRDEVVATARDAARAATDAKVTAQNTESLALSIQGLLALQAPCDPDSPPESPSCQRQARTDRIIAGALAQVEASLAKGVALHDASVHRQMEALRQRIAPTTAPIPAPPPPAASAPTTTTPPTTAPPRPPSTAPGRVTTDVQAEAEAICDPRGKSGKCKR